MCVDEGGRGALALADSIAAQVAIGECEAGFDRALLAATHEHRELDPAKPARQFGILSHHRAELGGGRGAPAGTGVLRITRDGGGFELLLRRDRNFTLERSSGTRRAQAGA